MSIKHLTPRSEQELQATMKNLSPREKLQTGAQQGIVWLVKDAIAAGANVHAGYDYALRLASEYGHAEVVKVLLDARGNVHGRGDWALQWASYKGHAEVVQLLLDAGTDMHAMDDSALRWASRNGHTEVVKLLKTKNEKMKTLTKQQFDLIPQGKVFATGVLPNDPSGIFMTDAGGNLRWVAKKGRGYDWAVYCHWDYNDQEWVEKYGDKVMNEIHIKRCVPCDEEVFNLYRF